MEYTTIRGKKMMKIPDAEFQFMQLWVECFPNNLRLTILPTERDKYNMSLSLKYGIADDDVKLQGAFGRRKDVWKLLNMPHKDFLKLGENILQIPRDDLIVFLSEYNNLLTEVAKKYGLIVPD